MTSILPASSLTADISDTNQLLDDLLHQLALHTDYSTLKQLKHTYHHITQQRHTHNAAVKQIVTQLTTDVEVIEQQLAAPDLNDARERRRRAETEVKESEARVTGLREVERAVRSEVEEKVDETQRLEQKQHEMQQRHNDSMAELKKCKKLYSILAAVKIDVASETHIKGSYHMGSQVRNFSYVTAQQPSDGLTSFDATNALWTRLSEAKVSSAFDGPSTPTSQLTSALSHFQFAV